MGTAGAEGWCEHGLVTAAKALRILISGREDGFGNELTKKAKHFYPNLGSYSTLNFAK